MKNVSATPHGNHRLRLAFLVARRNPHRVLNLAIAERAPHQVRRAPRPPGALEHLQRRPRRHPASTPRLAAGTRLGPRRLDDRVPLGLRTGAHRDTRRYAMPHRKPLRPAMRGVGPPGWPAWAPDGSRIAIATAHGIYLISPTAPGSNASSPRSADDPFGAGFFRPGIVRLRMAAAASRPDVQAAPGFSQTEMCAPLSLVNGSRLQSLQRSRSLIPAICAMRSSSAGHT